MLPSIIDQIKVSQEAGYQDNYGFECGLMPFYLEVCPLKAAFSGFQTQPQSSFTMGKTKEHSCDVRQNIVELHKLASG